MGDHILRRPSVRCVAASVQDTHRVGWAFAITATTTFMVALDSLVVTTALPAIQLDLGATLTDLQWTVNAYTLPFAVLLLTGAALGDRFGRRRVFCTGLVVFIASSTAAALANTTAMLVAARAVQGAGGAIVTPLALTILSDAVPRHRRGLALGAWGAVSGLAIAIGPLVGGAIVEGISWQWIFVINLPIGATLLPLARSHLVETIGTDGNLDLTGLALAAIATGATVFALVRASDTGWATLQVLVPLVGGAAMLVAFMLWEIHAATPMIPMGFFRNRAFTAANATSLLMFLGMFGAIFLLAQYLQGPLGYSPLQAGIRTLPWTAPMVVVGPIAGSLSDRIGYRPLIAAGMALLAIAFAHLATIAAPDVPYRSLVAPFVLAGIGMSLFFAPTAKAVLDAVASGEEGKASGVLNTIRQFGAVLGVALLSVVFSAAGGYGDPDTFSDGLTAALWVAAAAAVAGTATAMLIPRRTAGLEGPQRTIRPAIEPDWLSPASLRSALSPTDVGSPDLAPDTAGSART